MAVKYRAVGQPIGIRQISADDSNTMLPDIPAPGMNNVPTAIETDGAVFPTQSVTATATFSSAPTTSSSQSSTTATPTKSAAASTGGSGLTHADIVAIVVPIALLAILIPILVLWYLDRKNRAAAEKRSSRSSKEAMLHEHSNFQKPPLPKGPKPARPERTPVRSVVNPATPETRNSLGLFNFELSPPSTPGTGWMTPNPRFSIARALQMRRSQPSIVQSQPRTSRGDSDRPQTGESERHQTRASLSDPPPPYVTDAA